MDLKSFDWITYLIQNPDVARASCTKKFAEDHWINHGRFEGRIFPKISAQVFDWKFYTSYPDLTFIKTEEQALNHYIKHGKNEGRLPLGSINIPIKMNLSDKYFMIDLPAGLCNQLWALFNGIIIGHYTQRIIMVTGFGCNYNQSQKVPLGLIIDIKHLNRVIDELKLKTQVVDSTPQLNWKTVNFQQIINPIIHQPNRHHHLISILQRDIHPYISLGNLFVDLDKFYTAPEFRGYLMELFRKLRFVPEFYQIAETYKKDLGLYDIYAAVHLRLEDDFIKHFITAHPYYIGKFTVETFSQLVKKCYLAAFQRHLLPTDKIYVATYLLRSPNINNSFTTELKRLYPNMIFVNDVKWRHSNPHVLNGREIDALIDYILCLGANKFIGLDLSTFSISVSYALSDQNKDITILSAK
jgi:hypothetical protein